MELLVEESALSLMAGGGSGGSRYADAAYYLSPLPTAGVVRFIAAWPSLGLPETITEIPADQILTAASRVRRLWGWEPRSWARPQPAVQPGQIRREAGEKGVVVNLADVVSVRVSMKDSVTTGRYR